jgi:PEP-CTERM motif
MKLCFRLSRFVQGAIFSAVALAALGACQCVALAGGVAITTPTGLHSGDQFRIIYVTPGTIQATSGDINTYNSFVNQADQTGGVTYNGVAVHFSAVVSTDSVNAKVNIGLTTSNVFMLNSNGTSTEVAASADSNGLWSGNPLLADPVNDLSGTSYTGSVWTGTSGIGTEYSSYVTPDGASLPITATWGLGNTTSYVLNGNSVSNTAEVGQLGGAGYTWISTSNLASNSAAYQIYGISDVLTVVPEPSSFMISGLGLLMVGFARRKRD